MKPEGTVVMRILMIVGTDMIMIDQEDQHLITTVRGELMLTTTTVDVHRLMAIRMTIPMEEMISGQRIIRTGNSLIRN